MLLCNSTVIGCSIILCDFIETNFIIRKATIKDFERLYSIGRRIPELKVSKNETFMDKRDFKAAIINKKGCFLVAKCDKEIAGFSYSAIEGKTYGAIVYTALLPKFRGIGIGKRLVQESEKWLKQRKISSVYGLVTNQNTIDFMKHLGYTQGKKLIWMDKKL